MRVLWKDFTFHVISHVLNFKSGEEKECWAWSLLEETLKKEKKKTHFVLNLKLNLKSTREARRCIHFWDHLYLRNVYSLIQWLILLFLCFFQLLKKTQNSPITLICLSPVLSTPFLVFKRMFESHACSKCDTNSTWELLFFKASLKIMFK